jgi:hypothetical protein
MFTYLSNFHHHVIRHPRYTLSLNHCPPVYNNFVLHGIQTQGQDKKHVFILKIPFALATALINA